MSTSKQKKSFKELYEIERDKLNPGQEFIEKIAKLTRRSPFTVRAWIAGVQEPDELVKDVLSKEFGTDADILFPSNN